MSVLIHVGIGGLLTAPVLLLLYVAFHGWDWGEDARPTPTDAAAVATADEGVVQQMVREYLSNPDIPVEAWTGEALDEAVGEHVHTFTLRWHENDRMLSNGICNRCGEVVNRDLLARALARRS